MSCTETTKEAYKEQEVVYNRTLFGKKIHYELLANIFDGGVEFCDSKLWLKLAI